MDTTTTGEFDDIPATQVMREGWRGYFSSLAQQARETQWGLLEPQKRVIGLCVMLDEAEGEIERLRKAKKAK